MLFDYKRLAKPNSYATVNGKPVKRDLSRIEYIVIHNSGGTRDTCYNECDYFATGNTRSAGAHIFIDLDGHAGLSVPLKYTAWHCGGGLQGNEPGSHTYYGKCTNANSVGIELCGIADKYCTDVQIEKIRKVVRWIKKKCPNAKVIIRHWDVTGKQCLPVDSTELLTPDGWKYLDEISVGDTVCAYDSENDCLLFDDVKDVVDPYVASVVKNHNLEATRDHRMLVRQNGAKYKFHERLYGDLLNNKARFIIKTSSLLKTDGINLTDDEIRLLVWIQGDGHYMKQYNDSIYGIEFHFKKKRKIERLKSLLDDIGIQYREHWCKNETVHIRIYNRNLVDWAEKWLADKVFNFNLVNMSQEQFEVFYDEILVVDGCKSGTTESYSSSVKQNLDVVQAIAATHERRTCVTCIGRSDSNILFPKSNYTIGESPGTTPSVERETIVSCVTVPTGYILIRQNNRTFIVGNCPYMYKGKDNLKWEKLVKMIGD